MLKNNLLVCIAGLLIFTGCQYKQSATQLRDVGYLKFIGTANQEYSIVVNDLKRFDISLPSEAKSNEVYEVSSGKIGLKVFNKSGQIILQKEMYVGSSNTVEVSLP